MIKGKYKYLVKVKLVINRCSLNKYNNEWQSTKFIDA